MPAFSLSLFLLGCLGGLLPDLLRIVRNRHKVHMPAYLRKGNFWLGAVLLVLVGGLAAWVLGAASAKDALIYGYASPQLFSHLAGSLSSEAVERGGKPREAPFNLLKWWAS